MDPAERFSHRVQAYVAGRPSYPPELIQTLVGTVPPPADVADVGAGTGILSVLLAGAGYAVVAVEPSEPMRAAISGVRTVAGRAEETGLPDASVDLIAAAQAFHWFDRERTAREWRRVLRPGGWVALVWNEREKIGAGADFQRIVERYRREVSRARDGVQSRAGVEGFLAPGYRELTFRNDQTLDGDGLVARAASASYLPNAGDPDFAPMREELLRLVAERGSITLPQRTELFLGRLGADAS